MPAIDQIKIRMFRHGFGDCFLLQFMEGENRVSSMLIDCGLKAGDAEEDVSLRDVVNNITQTLTSPGELTPALDFLVITHEHWDHVSGFVPKRALFDQFQIDQIWMAWTEDPSDEVARQINRRLSKTAKALHLANDQIKEGLHANPGFYEQFYRGNTLLRLRTDFSTSLDQLIGFSKPFAAREEKTVTASGIEIKKFDVKLGTENAIHHVKTLSADSASIKYLSPGQIVQNRKKLPGLRIYVLGPPKNVSLNKDKPSAGHNKETYFSLRDASLDGFVNGLLAAHHVPLALPDDGAPFANTMAISKTDPSVPGLYGTTYLHPGNAWRTIEEDWLDIAGSLALQMDEDTNNTSLVLAIEFIDTGKVLLFPGDAQVGSWESWHELSFSVKSTDGTETVSASDLLARTAFYKVSHHCSHNATLSKLGLELMNSDELVAMVPEKNDQYSGIPHPALVDRLRQKTKGRLLFSADDNFPADDFKRNKPRNLSLSEWNEFIQRLDIQPLYIEYTVNV